jgi:hypothetical protein
LYIGVDNLGGSCGGDAVAVVYDDKTDVWRMVVVIIR